MEGGSAAIVLQRYIMSPLLTYGVKWDIRAYVLVLLLGKGRSRVWLHTRSGYARVASGQVHLLLSLSLFVRSAHLLVVTTAHRLCTELYECGSGSEVLHHRRREARLGAAPDKCKSTE